MPIKKNSRKSVLIQNEYWEIIKGYNRYKWITDFRNNYYLDLLQFKHIN